MIKTNGQHWFEKSTGNLYAIVGISALHINVALVGERKATSRGIIKEDFDRLFRKK